MIDISKAVDMLDTFVETETQQEAYTAGFAYALDPRNHLIFHGNLDEIGKPKTGLVAILEDDPSNKWTAERFLPRQPFTVTVSEPAFVLGAVCSAYYTNQLPTDR